MTKKQQKPIEIGEISGCHGIQGWVKVFSHTDPIDNIFSYKKWHLVCNQGNQTVKIKTGKVNGKRLIVRLEGVDSRDEAEALVGCRIVIDALPDLESGDYYWRDLVGLSVVDINGKPLGVVDELLATNAHDVLVVIDDAQKRHLIPYTYGVHVKEVSLPESQIVVDWDTDY